MQHGMRSLIMRGVTSLGLLASVSAGTAILGTANAGAVGSYVLYASPTATPDGADTSCATSPYKTISDAVAAASAGDTVVACQGTYTEDVVILKPLTLLSEGATIDATGLPGASTGIILGQAPYNGITIESSRVTVEGFTVKGAEGEGILAVNPHPVKGPIVGGMQLYTGKPLTKVVIAHNDVTGNDLGFNNANSPYVACTPNGGSDCGEGIHLMSVAKSKVIDNESMDNSGGILITDEYGPTHNNLIQGNDVIDNTNDCGITIPSHNLGINPETGQLDPSFAGVYRNDVTHNVVVGNGVKGYGAGIGVFAPETGTASYQNVISDNYIYGNGLAGISVHSHQANAYVDGNVFTGNTIGVNNVTGADGADVTPKDKQTTGILIWSDATKYHFTVTHNFIFDNTYGVWYTPKTIKVSGLSTNSYSVTKPVHRAT